MTRHRLRLPSCCLGVAFVALLATACSSRGDAGGIDAGESSELPQEALEQAVQDSFAANRDSTLSRAQPNRNHGAERSLRVGGSPSREQRAVVAFDLSDVPIEAERATLVLTLRPGAAHAACRPPRHPRFGGRGGRHHGKDCELDLLAAPLEADWVEGNGRRGKGVTWNCPVDREIANNVANCRSPWSGGLAARRRTRAGGPELNTVSFDVTADVRRGAGRGWLVTAPEQRAEILFYSREGAAAAGDPALGPRLVLEHASHLVGPAGGTVRAHGGRVVLEIPPGALGETVPITVTPTPIEADLPLSGLLPGTLHDFGPSGLTFALPATLGIAYDPADVPAAADPETLVLLSSVHAADAALSALDPWEERPSQADVARSRVRGTLEHFSHNGVGVPVVRLETSATTASLLPGETLELTARPFGPGDVDLNHVVDWSTEAGMMVALVFPGETTFESDGAVLKHASLSGAIPGSARAIALVVNSAADVNASAPIEVTVASAFQNPERRVLVTGQVTLTVNPQAPTPEVFTQSLNTVLDLFPDGTTQVFGTSVGNTAGNILADMGALVRMTTDGAVDVPQWFFNLSGPGGGGSVVITPPTPEPVVPGVVLTRGAQIASLHHMSWTWSVLNVPPLDRDSAEGACARWNEDRADLDEGTWTGNVAACERGDISAEGRNNAHKVTNLYRWLANMPFVATSEERNVLAQECALLQQANGPLTHMPPNTWTCWTDLGFDGSCTSNLAGPATINGVNTSGVLAVDSYMIDSGLGNASSLGHRRWILSNTLGPIGLGSTATGDSCMQVLPNTDCTTPASNTRQERQLWTAWPPPGPVPIESFRGGQGNLFPPIDETGWSLQSDSVDVTTGTVTVTSGGSNLPVTQSTLEAGFGSAYAVKFIANGWQTQAGQTYTVSVTGISPSISYDVSPVDCTP